MALLLLVRHALTDATGVQLSGALPGIHLSEKGRAQAATLAERLAPIRLAAVYSSPLERCTETAGVIVGRRGIQVRPIAALEEVGYGRWAGRPLARLAKTELWKLVHRTPSAVRFPGGETFAEVQQRAVGAVQEIAGRHPRRAVVIVTHADVIRLVLAQFAGVHIDLYQRFTVSPASVSAVVLDEREPRVLRVNDTGTLGDLAEPARPHRPSRPTAAGS